MTDRLLSEKVTTTWELDPPLDVPSRYTPGRQVRVHFVIHEHWNDDRDHWGVRGVPLTTKGNPNGTIDHRSVTEEALDELRRRVGGVTP